MYVRGFSSARRTDFHPIAAQRSKNIFDEKKKESFTDSFILSTD